MIDWKDIKFSAIGDRFEASPESVGLHPFLKKAFEGGSAVSHFFQEGYSDKAFEEILKKISDLKGRKVYENISSVSEEYMFMWDDAFVDISHTKSKMMSINAVSANEAVTEACKEVAKLFSVPAKKGYVFAITRSQHGLQLTRIGYAGSPVERTNYTDEVCKDYDYIIEDLRSKDPTGRIVILDGPPGTGKCVAAGTPIMNPDDGILYPIEEIINKKINVLSFNSKEIISKTPSAWLDTGVKECYSIKLKSGNVLIGTPEHPVMTVDGWEKISNLSCDSYIATASKIPFPKTNINISDEEIYILAGLLAEGNYTQNHVSFSNTDSGIIELMNSSLSFIDGYLKQYPYQKSCDFRISSPKIGRISKIRNLLNKFDIGHKLAKDKIIPNIVFSFNEEQLSKFIGYLWSCDGSIESRGTITIGLASEKFIDQIQHLLLRFGILTNKNFKVSRCNVKEFDSWRLSVLSTCKHIFKEKIPLIGKKKELLENMIIYHNPNDDLIPLTETLKNNLIKISNNFIKDGGKISDVGSILNRSKRKDRNVSSFSIESLIRRKHISKRVLSAFINTTKNYELEWLLKLRWTKISKIENVGEKRVFDLTISDNHCFIANDILVHNTYLIRGILMDVPKAMFVIVPPNMIASIGGPELLPLLLRTKEDYGKKGPVVFILEDADQCLAPRESDNISAISAILNLGDGIFGSLFDVRILATTNAKAQDLDRAITRDMRLSKRISIGPFTHDEANIRYKRIFNDQTKELPRPTLQESKSSGFGGHSGGGKKSMFTLAEIYKLARDNGWKSAKNEEEPANPSVPVTFDEDDFDVEYMG